MKKLTLIIIIISFFTTSCEKKKFEDDRAFLIRTLNNTTWQINSIDILGDNVNNVGDKLKFTIYELGKEPEGTQTGKVEILFADGTSTNSPITGVKINNSDDISSITIVGDWQDITLDNFPDKELYQYLRNSVDVDLVNDSMILSRRSDTNPGYYIVDLSKK